MAGIPGMQGSAAVGASVLSSALEKTGRSLQKILERLATAQRINRASDDAAGLSIAEQLTTQIRGFKMASQNVSDAMSALDIADSTTGQVADMLQRQRELSLQASNDTLTDQQRQNIDVEYQALNQEIDRISASANYNTQGVANGQDLASGTAQVQVGPNQGDQVVLPQVRITAAMLGTAGTSVATSAGAGNALTSIDTALDRLNSQRSQLGATVNKMEHIQNNISVAETNSQAAESVLRDQDMALGVTQLTTAQLLQESGTSAFARFREISANHLYSLLQ
jgi:flagellin